MIQSINLVRAPQTRITSSYSKVIQKYKMEVEEENESKL